MTNDAMTNVRLAFGMGHFSPNAEVANGRAASAPGGARRSRRRKPERNNAFGSLLDHAHFCGLKAALLAIGTRPTPEFRFSPRPS